MADDKTFTKDELDAAIAAAVGKVQDSIDKLETKNSELLDEAKKAKAELRKVKDISPEDVAAIEAERDKALTDLTEANKALKTAATERDKAVKALETESAFTQKLLIQDGLKTALIANGVKDEDYLDMAVAKFSPSATISIEGDKREAKIGDKPLADAIKEWAVSDAGKKVVAAAVNGGGGAPGGDGKGGGGKKATQAQVDAMAPKARSEFFTTGGSIAEAA